MTSGIYEIYNKVTGKRYIGSSKNIESRWKSHKRMLEQKNHHSIKLQHSYNKYKKKNFLYSILEECPENNLFDREDYYIELYNSFENGYNCTAFSKHPTYENDKPKIKIYGEVNRDKIYHIKEIYDSCWLYYNHELPYNCKILCYEPYFLTFGSKSYNRLLRYLERLEILMYDVFNYAYMGKDHIFVLRDLDRSASATNRITYDLSEYRQIGKRFFEFKYYSNWFCKKYSSTTIKYSTAYQQADTNFNEFLNNIDNVIENNKHHKYLLKFLKGEEKINNP